MSENKDTRTATQKIEDLEKVVTILYQTTLQLQENVKTLAGGYATFPNDMSLIKDALKLLNKKTEAIVQVAAAETGISVQSVSDLVTKMNVVELTGQVNKWVADGQLISTDVVDDKSYLVVEESTADGAITSPRTQFRMDSLDQATADVLKGKKVGDKVSFGPNKFDAKLLEIYTVVDKAQEASANASDQAASPPEAAPAEAAPAEAPAAEVPAANPAAAAFDSPPAETPVVQFVPSDASTMMTASS